MYDTIWIDNLSSGEHEFKGSGPFWNYGHASVMINFGSDIRDPLPIKYTKTIVSFNQMVFYRYKNKQTIRLCHL